MSGKSKEGKVIIFDYFGHMVATESEMELHRFARKLGLKRRWFQKPLKNSKKHSHYDLTTGRKMVQAAKLGAKQVSSKEILIRAWWAKESCSE